MNSERQCIKCSDSCLGCLSDEACFSCSAGYYLATVDESVTGKCLTCYDTCKTCSQFAYLCTSCKTGYVLDGSKCISEVHLDYTLTVNSPVESMAGLTRTFLGVLIDFATKYSLDSANPLAITGNDITLNKLKQGSAVTSGSISTYTQAQSDQIAVRMSSELAGTQLENGYSIIAVESNVVVPNNTD